MLQNIITFSYLNLLTAIPLPYMLEEPPFACLEKFFSRNKDATNANQRQLPMSVSKNKEC